MAKAFITGDNVNLRTGPGTTFIAQGQVHTGAAGELLERHASCDPAYAAEWHRIRFEPEGREAWVYSQYVRIEEPAPVSAPIRASGTIAILEPAPTIVVRPPSTGLYPTPVAYNDFTNGYTDGHLGWDFAGNEGTPVYGGPLGGVVVANAYCQKCGPAGSSALKPGERPGRSDILNDAAWNFGYGHYVIVRYDNLLLPESTHNYLEIKGWRGYHAFVMYAHLKSFSVRKDDTLGRRQELGKMGTSGNSDGFHLHLELRFGPKADAAWWVRLRPFLSNPGVMFAVR